MAYDLYRKFNKLTDAIQLALRMNNREVKHLPHLRWHRQNGVWREREVVLWLYGCTNNLRKFTGNGVVVQRKFTRIWMNR